MAGIDLTKSKMAKTNLHFFASKIAKFESNCTKTHDQATKNQ
jgi:hypothetical protein